MLQGFLGKLDAKLAVEALHAGARRKDHRKQLFQAAALPRTIKGRRPADHQNATTKFPAELAKQLLLRHGQIRRAEIGKDDHPKRSQFLERGWESIQQFAGALHLLAK